MIAFHEAVKSYEPSKGDFKALAATVIRRRLVDYGRSEARHANEIYVEPQTMDGDIDEENPTSLQLEIRQKEAELSAASSGGSPAGSAVRDEIEAVQELLSAYGFSFFDLADCSPKAEKTKKQCAKAVVTLLGEAELFAKMQNSRTLPGKELLRASGVPKKILERHRKYIIAAAEILNGEYPLLAEYMNYIRRELRT